jgi:hypothetical protein
MVALLASVLPSTAWGQSLGQIRSDVRDGESHEPEHDHKEHKRDRRKHSGDHHYEDHHHDDYVYDDHHHDAYCDDDDDWDSLLGHMFLIGATAPFWAPRSVVNDESFDPGSFARYPYLHGMDGYMATKNDHAADEYLWLLRLYLTWKALAHSETSES